MKLEAIIARITYLREKNNAIILAHNYQLPEVQDISDLLGDSLDLSMKAKKTNADNIIFCGVDFMAESAKILNPEKNVIIPDIDARCPMANMVDLKDLEKLKNKNPDAKVVAYINTTSDVKAISDVCCTSSNGVKVVKSLKSEKVIFVPDKNLGSYIQRFVPEKQMILWPGMCTTHHRISKQDIFKLKKEHPESEVLVHPECRPEIINIADHVFSTNGMVNYAKNSDVKEFIIGTEKELCYRLKNENPNKMFYPIKSAICPISNLSKYEKNNLGKSLK